MLLFETLLLAKFLESCVTDVGQLLKSLDILVSQVTELFKPGHELPHGFTTTDMENLPFSTS